MSFPLWLPSESGSLASSVTLLASLQVGSKRWKQKNILSHKIFTSHGERQVT